MIHNPYINPHVNTIFNKTKDKCNECNKKAKYINVDKLFCNKHYIARFGKYLNNCASKGCREKK